MASPRLPWRLANKRVHMKPLRWVAVIAVLGVMTTIPFLLAKRQEFAAKRFVASIQEIQVGSGNIQLMRQLLSKCGSKCSATGGKCDKDGCDLIFGFDNTSLSRFRLAPFTHLGGTISLHENVVDSVAIAYTVSCQRMTFSGVFIREAQAAGDELPFRVSNGPEGKPPALSVRITPAVSADQKNRVFGLNYSCLSRIGGCSGVSELVPSLAEPDSLSCRGGLPNR